MNPSLTFSDRQFTIKTTVARRQNIMGKNEYTLCRNFIFAITGKVNYFANREELVNYIESEGGKVGSSVTANTDFLINNNIDNQSEKTRRLKNLGFRSSQRSNFLSCLEVIMLRKRTMNRAIQSQLNVWA